jgi:nitrate/TMAO reductase-like tetraheme cytochrome c subunit
MRRALAGAVALELWPAWAIASAGAVPHPRGWIGTADQWAQGLGIAIALLDLLVLAIAWRHVARTGTLHGALGALFFGLAILPVIVIFFGYSQGMSRMESVRACGDCHTMTSHVRDLENPASQSLAAVHFKNRYIRDDQCYTCHSDYGLFGTLSAKMDGVRHVYRYVTGTYTLPLHVASPYPNIRCLECHRQSQKFLTSEGHPAEIRPLLFSGDMSCLTCHAPAHTADAQGKQAAR